VDQTCGLLVSLGLSPVLVLVGIARGPALSSGKKVHSVSGPLLASPRLYYKDSANAVLVSMHERSHPRCECLPD
jgi:hypothetical protein